jgi:hypothetical protein
VYEGVQVAVLELLQELGDLGKTGAAAAVQQGAAQVPLPPPPFFGLACVCICPQTGTDTSAAAPKKLDKKLKKNRAK